MKHGGEPSKSSYILTERRLLLGESNGTSESESKSVSRISVVSEGGLEGRGTRDTGYRLLVFDLQYCRVDRGSLRLD